MMMSWRRHATVTDTSIFRKQPGTLYIVLISFGNNVSVSLMVNGVYAVSYWVTGSIPVGCNSKF
jgi:hypothetical protein